MLILKLGSLQYFGNILLKKLSNIKTKGIFQNYIERAIKNVQILMPGPLESRENNE